MSGRLTKLAEPLILIALAIAALSAWIFLGIADEVAEGDTQLIDGWVLFLLRDPADFSTAVGPAWLRTASRDITALGDIGILMFIVLVVTGFLALARRWHTAGFVLAATLSGSLMAGLLKQVFERNRPSFASPEVYIATSSFPSGHAMMSAVVYLTLAALLARLVSEVRLKAYVLGVALIVTWLIGLSRVYLGVHWPSDVAAGWAVGAAWALAWWILAQIFLGPEKPGGPPRPDR